MTMTATYLEVHDSGYLKPFLRNKTLISPERENKTV